MTYPKVSIIILNWNRLQDITECLESVYKSSYPNYDVIVVDNASTDGSPEKIKETFPEIVVIKNAKNLGYAGGNNVGIRYAMGKGAKYVWLLNDDTIIEPDTLKKLILKAEIHPMIGLLSPVIRFFNGEIQHCGSIVDFNDFTIRNIKDIDDVTIMQNNITSLYGTALLIKKAVIETTGYLNEKYFAYDEDLEYSMRVLRDGFSNIIVKETYIYHKEHNLNSKGTRNLPPYFFYYITRNRFFFWMSNLHGMKKILFMKRYITNCFMAIGSFREINQFDFANCCIDGIYCAFRNIGGQYKPPENISSYIRKLILWHPYLLADLLSFDFRKILVEGLKRLGLLKNKICQKSA